MWEEFCELALAEQQKQEVRRVLACNERSREFGMELTKEDAEQLIICRRDALREQKRVEFGESVLPLLTDAFCDSEYIEPDAYALTLAQLQEVFYLFKNEVEDRLTDGELIEYMREQFDGVCRGSVEYLSETCLERFARAVRFGYRGYEATEGRGEYSRISEETHWEKELYLTALYEEFG